MAQAENNDVAWELLVRLLKAWDSINWDLQTFKDLVILGADLQSPSVVAAMLDLEGSLDQSVSLHRRLSSLATKVAFELALRPVMYSTPDAHKEYWKMQLGKLGDSGELALLECIETQIYYAGQVDTNLTKFLETRLEIKDFARIRVQKLFKRAFIGSKTTVSPSAGFKPSVNMCLVSCVDALQIRGEQLSYGRFPPFHELADSPLRPFYVSPVPLGHPAHLDLATASNRRN